MGRAVSSLGVRTALVAGLVVLLFGPASAPAFADDCPGSLQVFNFANSPPASSLLRDRKSFVEFHGGGGPAFWPYSLILEGGGWKVWFAHLDSLTNQDGDETRVFTPPYDFPLGDAQVEFVVKGCHYYYPITVTQALSLNPGVTLTTAPPVFNPNPGVTLTTTTTTTTSTTTSTTTVPVAPVSSSTTTAPSIPASEATTSTIAAQVASTSPVSSSTPAAASPISSSTSTTLVAASNASADQGPPWTVWLIGGLVGLVIASATILSAVRRRAQG